MRIAKRLYALHVFHPTLPATCVSATSSKRARKDGSNAAANAASMQAEPMDTLLPQQPLQNQPQLHSHSDYLSSGDQAPHLTANGCFVRAYTSQLDFSGLQKRPGRKVWMDASEAARLDALEERWGYPEEQGYSEEPQAQPEMTVLDKVCPNAVWGTVRSLRPGCVPSMEWHA